MNYSKADLIDAITSNDSIIKSETETKKKAEKILSLIADLENEAIVTITTIHDLIEVASRADFAISEAKTRNTKHKKQLKLIEQMEALESEVVGE